MHLGRYQLGDRIPLAVFCRDAGGAPVLPTAAPVCRVYAADAGTPVYETRLPPADAVVSPGLFLHGLHLDARFAAGYYSAVVAWESGGSTKQSGPHPFEILPGGNADGSVIAIHPYSRPHAEFLIYQTDAAKLFRGRNPRVQ